jgi:hypothetical protein
MGVLDSGNGLHDKCLALPGDPSDTDLRSTVFLPHRAIWVLPLLKLLSLPSESGVQ